MDVIHTHCSFYGHIPLENAEFKIGLLKSRLFVAFNMPISVVNFQENPFLEQFFCRASHGTRTSWGTLKEDNQMAISTCRLMEHLCSDALSSLCH
jgi:hypothetical protein